MIRIMFKNSYGQTYVVDEYKKATHFSWNDSVVCILEGGEMVAAYPVELVVKVEKAE